MTIYTCSVTIKKAFYCSVNKDMFNLDIKNIYMQPEGIMILLFNAVERWWLSHVVEILYFIFCDII